MNKKGVLSVAVSLIALAAAAEKPNFLVIFCDDLTYRAANDSQPFFLWLAPRQPHVPLLPEQQNILMEMRSRLAEWMMNNNDRKYPYGVRYRKENTKQ